MNVMPVVLVFLDNGTSAKKNKKKNTSLFYFEFHLTAASAHPVSEAPLESNLVLFWACVLVNRTCIPCKATHLRNTRSLTGTGSCSRDWEGAAEAERRDFQQQIISTCLLLSTSREGSVSVPLHCSRNKRAAALCIHVASSCWGEDGYKPN